MSERKKLKVAFVHPDLGIGTEDINMRMAHVLILHLHKGGAERLVVDAALGLQNLGHSIDIYTSHHDPKHSFEETRDGASV